MAKLEIGLCRGKKTYDKRESKGTRYQTRFSSNQERVLKQGKINCPLLSKMMTKFVKTT
jgi:tmRNA-binding protein